MSKNIFTIFCLIFLALSNVLADVEEGGQPGAFLRMGLGTEAMAMGRAYTAVASDATALYWNPAGLAFAKQLAVHATSMRLPWDRQGQQLAFAVPLGPRGTLAAGWLHLTIDDIEARNRTGALDDYFSSMESAYFVSYGFFLHPTVSFGASAKWIQQTLYDHAAKGAGFDMGILYQMHPHVRLGFTLKDLSTRIRWNTDSETIETYPLRLHAGVLFFKQNFPFHLSLEYRKIHNQTGSLHAGLQYALWPGLTVCAGLDNSEWALGGQMDLPLKQVDIRLGYALGKDPLSDDYVHRFSLQVAHQIKRRKSFSAIRDEVNQDREPYEQIVRKQDVDREKYIQVIKISEKYSQYGIVNRGKIHGLEPGQDLILYRLIATSDMENIRQILIGVLEVVRVGEREATVQAVHMRKGFLLQVGDLCRLKRE